MLALLLGFHTITFESGAFMKISLSIMKLLQQETRWYLYFVASLCVVAENVVTDKLTG